MVSPLNKILQIVPRLFPDVDGVGDYTLQLAHQLFGLYHIKSEFLVFRPSGRTQSNVEGFTVYSLHSHTIEGFISQIPTDISTVVLQYSNYPYLVGKLDTPLWLVAAIKLLKQRGLRIIVMFHELPTLRYRNLRCPNVLQRRVSRGLAQVADAVVTNNAAFQQTLSRWAASPVLCIPNFSTIGEPRTIPPLDARERSLIVFGSSERARVYRDNHRVLCQVCQHLSITKLYDIGRPIDFDFSRLAAEVEVINTGVLSAPVLSDLMLTAFAGLFDYRRFPKNLSKSTVYAAYCAHGLLPICNRDPLCDQDGIIAYQHYLPTTDLPNAAAPMLPFLQKVVDRARRQYQTHTLRQCTDRFAAYIQPTATMLDADSPIVPLEVQVVP